MHILNLAGAWQLTSTQRPLKMTAPVPGDVHSALIRAGKIEDPYWGENELDVQWVGREDWIYEQEFKIPQTILREKSVFLSVEGLDTMATIRINGREVAQTRNAFLRYRFEVKEFLKPGLNRLTIELASPEKAAQVEAEKQPYAVPHNHFPVMSMHRNLVRKPQCHSGWDWGLCLMISEIRGPIYLGATSLARIDNVTTDQKHSATGVEVTVSCAIESPEGGAARFEVELDGQTWGSSVELKPGLNQLRKTVRIRQPKLWWPNGFGEQPLYDLTVRAGGDTLRKRIGLRTIKLVNNEDKNGLSMTFVVNGQPIFCKGANWIPADALPQRVTRVVLDDLLTSATAAHMNMLRVWGGGQYESDDFYDLCDEKGLLVWQDFMFACSMYPATPDFLANVRDEARYQVSRLRDRACLALWCGNNENVGALNWYRVAKENRDRYLVDYDRLNEGVLGNAVRELDPERIFWPSSPCGGPGDYSDCWKDDTRGDMHFWSVWHEGKPFEDYLEIKPRFCSEFGYQSFPSMECIRSYAPEGELNVSSPILEHHQRNPGGNARITENMTRYYRFPESFDKFVYLSQVQQSMAMQMAVEHFRSLRPICMGALYWQLNDLWPVCSWASLEYGGKWKLLNYVAKRFFAPVLITAKPGKDSIQIWAVNDHFTPVAASARIRVINFAGKVLRTIRLDKRLPGGSSVLLKEIPVKSLVDNPKDAFLSLDLKAGTAVSRNTHLFCPYKKCTLVPARVRFTVAAARKNFAVTLTTDAPAFWVRLDAVGIRGEFDDNGFCLLPGETKRLIFSPKEKTTLEKFRKKLELCHLRQTYR